MARRSRGTRTVTLTGPLLEGYMLLKGYGGTQPTLTEDETAKIVLTMVHLALVEKDQGRALAIVKGLVQAARSGEKKEETVSP